MTSSPVATKSGKPNLATAVETRAPPFWRAAFITASACSLAICDSVNPISTARQHNHLPGQLIRHVRHASPSCHRPPCQRRHRPLHILLVTSPSPSPMFSLLRPLPHQHSLRPPSLTRF